MVITILGSFLKQSGKCAVQDAFMASFHDDQPAGDRQRESKKRYDKQPKDHLGNSFHGLGNEKGSNAWCAEPVKWLAGLVEPPPSSVIGGPQGDTSLGSLAGLLCGRYSERCQDD